MTAHNRTTTVVVEWIGTGFNDYVGHWQPNDLFMPFKAIDIISVEGHGYRGKTPSEAQYVQAITGPKALGKYVRQMAAYGVDVQTHFVPHGTNIELEAGLASEALLAMQQAKIQAGVRNTRPRACVDFEQNAPFWQVEMSRIAEYLERIRDAVPDAYLDITVHPYGSQLERLPWVRPYVDGLWCAAYAEGGEPPSNQVTKIAFGSNAQCPELDITIGFGAMDGFDALKSGILRAMELNYSWSLWRRHFVDKSKTAMLAALPI